MSIKTFKPTTPSRRHMTVSGFDGVDKRLDVIATAMQAGLGVRALKELDLAYAPPYSSAKDPVNMLGFVAENVITGKVKHFFYEDIANLPKDGSVTLLDHRTAVEDVRIFSALPESQRERHIRLIVKRYQRRVTYCSMLEAIQYLKTGGGESQWM